MAGGTFADPRLKPRPLPAQPRCQASWLSSLLVALFTFYSFSPINVLRFQSRWYYVLAFCLVIFAANRARFSVRAAGPFLAVSGLTILGAFLAPLRSGFTEDVLRNSVGMSIGLLSFLLLLPTLAEERSRRWVVLSLLLCSLLWLLRLRSIVAELGDDTHQALSGHGQDKNMIAFVLVLGMTILLGAALFWRGRRGGTLVGWGIRIAALVGSLGMLLFLAFTFSRSGLLVGLFMVFVGLLAYALKNRLGGLAVALCLAALVAGLASVSIPMILARLPSWERNFDRLVHWRTDDNMSARREFLRKGWLIVRENPIVGIGAGMSKAYVLDAGEGIRPGFLVHNGYLTSWAELGLGGLAASLGLIGLWLIEMRARIRDPHSRTVDFACLLASGAMLAMNFFLDYGTILWFFAALICALSYERRLRSAKRNRFGRIYVGGNPSLVAPHSDFSRPQSPTPRRLRARIPV